MIMQKVTLIIIANGQNYVTIKMASSIQGTLICLLYMLGSHYVYCVTVAWRTQKAFQIHLCVQIISIMKVSEGLHLRKGEVEEDSMSVCHHCHYSSNTKAGEPEQSIYYTFGNTKIILSFFFRYHKHRWYSYTLTQIYVMTHTGKMWIVNTLRSRNRFCDQ